MKRAAPDHLPQHRFPLDPWRFIEREYDVSDIGVTETLFAVANGYIGMRANPEEGRDAHSHGTFLNGFHETWHIHHAEEAFGFAKTGQTIVNVPDAKVMKLYVDDEPLLLSSAELEGYERVLDVRDGTLTRDLVWRTPGGKLVHVRSQRLVSLVHRHLAVLTFEVTMLEGSAPVVVSSQLLNRQDGEDEYHVAAHALGHGNDPRKIRAFDHRVLVPRLQHDGEGETLLGYRCANSGMTLTCGVRHRIDTEATYRAERSIGPDLAKTVITARAQPGQTIRITKLVSYHSSTGVPVQELADRCRRTLDRATDDGTETIFAEQRQWLVSFWSDSDVEIYGDEAAQQAVRWNLFQLAQASAQTNENGVAAKGVTGGGYEGHYFWDTETYVVPFLAYTSPNTARKLLRWRWHTLPTARQRAATLNQVGALYPWRTINGEEASAYYAAGTAQYHINAAIAFALKRYLDASGDIEFLAGEGAEILVETARLWEDLGFYGSNGSPQFRIHGVTGPDEYTTVVNDNMYTNTMARFNMRYASRVVDLLRQFDGDAYASLARRVQLADGEPERWADAADSMYLPYDDVLGIHPQDDGFLELERWNFENTPAENYPLLLHYHPLVIYRHQVLKQSDVVLAMALRSDQFSLDQKRRNFDYYDPITTGDSSLSACVQAMAAAQIGYDDLALEYFREALFVDLADTHGNTVDGVHVASAGGVWGTIAFGFAGLFDSGTALRFTPSLPDGWQGLMFRMQRHGSRLVVDLDHGGCTVQVLSGHPVPIDVNPVGDEQKVVMVPAGDSVRIEALPLE